MEKYAADAVQADAFIRAIRLESKRRKRRTIMKFDSNNYTVEEMTLEDTTVRFRAFRGLVYVEHPVNPEFQQMNLFVPELYYEGGTKNGYDIHTAPVFMPNTVGGYMPGELDEPGWQKMGPRKPNSIFQALDHGYVVAAPAIRGRVQKNSDGVYTGKAPACIVDYKAAVRYLHFFADVLPGAENKIITSGTSAGGALSALMGASGNHPDYEPYLKKLGAAEAEDAVFAASCYCPITNLDHADMAYEWQFDGIYEYHRMDMKMEEGGRPSFTPEDGRMDEDQIRVSGEEKALFPPYLNSLGLLDADGGKYTLSDDGTGNFKEYLEKVIAQSAQTELDKGRDLSEKTWLTVRNGIVEGVDFAGYAKDITRMKTAPAFDALDLSSQENNLFGTAETDCCHFTEYSRKHSLAEGTVASGDIVRMMNPMNYIGEKDAKTAKYWRIRHGECDRDTSLAVSAMLSIRLENAGCDVDYRSPWGIPHAGDYDLKELFAWIDGIVKESRQSR